MAIKAKAAGEKAITDAGDAGLDPPDLEQLPADAMSRRGLARKSDGTPTNKTQRNFTDSDSHLMQRRQLPAGLQLPAGGGPCPPGDRGCGGEQPAAGCRTPGAHVGTDRRQLWSTTDSDDTRCGLLQRSQRVALRAARHRCLPRDGPTAASPAATAQTKAFAQRGRCQNPHRPQAQI